MQLNVSTGLLLERALVRRHRESLRNVFLKLLCVPRTGIL